MKVLVHSRFREGMVVVGRDWDRQGIALLKFRQFKPISPKSPIGQCYMTPEEAMFVVECHETRQHEASGEPNYWYPSGYPVPMPDDKGEMLTPAVTQETAHVNDSRQTLAAQAVNAEREAAMRQKQIEHNEVFGAEGDPDAPLTVPEFQTRNSGRRKSGG